MSPCRHSVRSLGADVILWSALQPAASLPYHSIWRSWKVERFWASTWLKFLDVNRRRKGVCYPSYSDGSEKRNSIRLSARYSHSRISAKHSEPCKLVRRLERWSLGSASNSACARQRAPRHFEAP